MATIRREALIDAPLDQAWSALRRFDEAGRLFAGPLVDCQTQGDVRTVTFANGLVVSERLVTVEDEERRLVYTVLDGPFSQHSASMQLHAAPNGCRFVWTSDFLPDEVAASVLPMIEEGCAAIRRNLAGEGPSS